jgi:hypothetical protein
MDLAPATVGVLVGLAICIVILIIILIVFFVGSNPLIEGGFIDQDSYGKKSTKYRCVGAACYMTQQDAIAWQQQQGLETQGQVLQSTTMTERPRIYLPSLDPVAVRPLRPADRIPVPQPIRSYDYEENRNGGQYSWQEEGEERHSGFQNNAINTSSSDDESGEETRVTHYVSQAPRVIQMPQPIMPQPVMARPVMPMTVMPQPVMQPVTMISQQMMTQPVVPMAMMTQQMMSQPMLQQQAVMPVAMMQQPIMQPMAMMQTTAQTVQQPQVLSLPTGPTAFYAQQRQRTTEYEEQVRTDAMNDCKRC